MKKGLLLSVVASGFIFAGGNIAPVQPVVPAAAPAACDFWGSLGARYEFIKDNGVGKNDTFGKKDNTWKAAVVLGVKKDLGYGFGFGAELGAFSHLGLTKIATSTKNVAEISQLYVTYKAANTTITAGRQALPENLSPWAWSDRTVGVLDKAFNGVVIVNTDIANTTLVGAWVASISDEGTTTKIDTANGTDKGLYMLGAKYTGVANTTFDVSAYYVPKALSTNDKAYSVWASAQTKVSNVDLGLQLAYSKVKAAGKATFGVAAYAGTKIDAFETKLTLAYINAGKGTLNPTGDTSGFWGSVGYSNFGGDINGGKQKIAKLDLAYTLPNNYGKLFAGVAYDKTSGTTGAQPSKDLAARVGYGFKVSGVSAKIEYRYTKNTPVTGAATKIQKVRIEGIYKF